MPNMVMDNIQNDVKINGGYSVGSFAWKAYGESELGKLLYKRNILHITLYFCKK